MWKRLLTFLLEALGQAALDKGVDALTKKDVDTTGHL
jgi:hypothetical protein